MNIIVCVKHKNIKVQITIHTMHNGNFMNLLLKVIKVEKSNMLYYEYKIFDLCDVSAKNEMLVCQKTE